MAFLLAAKKQRAYHGISYKGMILCLRCATRKQYHEDRILVSSLKKPAVHHTCSCCGNKISEA